MARHARAGWGYRLRLAVVVGLMSGIAAGAEQRPDSRRAPRKGSVPQQEGRADGEPADLFAAMGQGQVDARLVALGTSRCTVYLANLTPRPLDVLLPEVFVGSPTSKDSRTQTLGSGFPFDLTGGEHVPRIPEQGQPAPRAAPSRPGVAQAVPPAPRRTRPPDPENYVRYGPNLWVPRGQVFQGQPGLPAQVARGQDLGRSKSRTPVAEQLPPAPCGLRLHLAPKATLKFELPAVCLERSKGVPNENLAYVLLPIESFTREAAVHHICRMLARGQIRQQVAQIAAWHLTDKAPFSGSAQDVQEAEAAVQQALRGDIPPPPDSESSDPGKHDSMSRQFN